MHTVEIRRQGEGIASPLAEMRAWLQRQGIEARLFELSFLPGKVVRFRLQFRDPSEAAAFAQAFAGHIPGDLGQIAA